MKRASLTQEEQKIATNVVRLAIKTGYDETNQKYSFQIVHHGQVFRFWVPKEEMRTPLPEIYVARRAIEAVRSAEG